MERKALMIGASPANEQPIQGVYTDIKLWQDFLKSNQGGAWDEDEIIVLKDPTLSQVKKNISILRNCHYSIVTFSGHGYVKDDFLGFPETFVVLNEEEEISEIDLNPKNDRCMIVIDCCRKLLTNVDMLKAALLFSYTESSDLMRDNYRNIYNDHIMKCEKGCIKLYAADIGQSAADENSFSSILLKISHDWASKKFGILEINEAMSLTKKYFQKINPQQSPRYQGGRRLHHFPFALNMEKYND